MKITNSSDVFGLSSTKHLPPPPKNVEQGIYEYVDCSNKDTFFTTKLL